MNKLLVALVCVLASSVAAEASVTLEIDAGFLRTKNGTAPVPQGGLLQLIASPSGSAANFAAPTATSFTGGDNIVVASFAMNYSGGTTPETDNFVTFNLANTAASTAMTFDAGDPLLLRWYPTLTYANLGTYTGPGLNTTYGQGRSDVAIDGGSAWITPGNNTTSTVLTFITTDDGGHQLISAGYAGNTVPEPSVGLMCGLGLMIVVGARQTVRRLKAT